MLMMYLNANGISYIHAYIYQLQGPGSIVLKNENLL